VTDIDYIPVCSWRIHGCHDFRKASLNNIDDRLGECWCKISSKQILRDRMGTGPKLLTVHYKNNKNIFIGEEATANEKHPHGAPSMAHVQLNVHPLDRSLALIQQKQIESKLHICPEPRNFKNFDKDQYLQRSCEDGGGGFANPKSRLKTAPLYTKYPAANLPYSVLGGAITVASEDQSLPAQQLDVKTLTKMPMDQMTRWVSQTGVLSLIERGIVPKAAQKDMASILKGGRDKSYLRAIKSRIFPIELKTDLGSIWEQPRRVYLPALRLDKALQNQPSVQNEENMYIDIAQQQALKQILDNDDIQSSLDGRSSTIIFDEDEMEKTLLSQSVNQLNPKYSSGWVLYIQNGILLETNSPSFCSYYSTVSKLNLQSAAGLLMEGLLNWATMYSIPLITVKCSEIIELCREPLCFPIPAKKLLDCVFNREQVSLFSTVYANELILLAPSQVEQLMSQKTRLYLNGDIGKNIAARTIQYYYYRHRTRYTAGFVKI
jgi:hypothetical protein